MAAIVALRRTMLAELVLLLASDGHRNGPTATYMVHMFDRICRENGIEHRLTKPNHPWTNSQLERMNRTLEEATVRRYHYESHDQLPAHLQTFLEAYNIAKRLKT